MKKQSDSKTIGIKEKKVPKKKVDDKRGHITFAEGLRRIAKSGKLKE